MSLTNSNEYPGTPFLLIMASVFLYLIIQNCYRLLQIFKHIKTPKDKKTYVFYLVFSSSLFLLSIIGVVEHDYFKIKYSNVRGFYSRVLHV